MFLYLRAALAAILLFATAAHGQPAVPLTLAEVEDRALDADPGRTALLASAEALRKRSVAAGELPDPVLRLGLNNYPIESGGFSTEGMTHAGVGIRQVFPAGRTRALSTAQLTQFAGARDAEADARVRDVLTASRHAWLDAYLWQRSRKLLEESRPFFSDLADISRSLYEVGRRSQQDVLRAELELSRLDDRLIDSDRQLALARAALSEWVGEASRRPIARKLPPWKALPPIEDLHDGLQSHPLLLAAEAQIEARDSGVALARQRNKPRWSLDVGYSYREGFLPNGAPRSDFMSVGVTVDLPFFRKRSIDSVLAAALAEESAAKASRERLSRSLSSRLESEYAHWLELTRRLELYESRILRQANDHAEAALLAYQNDRADFADVMRGFIDDLNARTQYLLLQVERARSYAVLANLGGLPR